MRLRLGAVPANFLRWPREISRSRLRRRGRPFVWGVGSFGGGVRKGFKAGEDGHAAPANIDGFYLFGLHKFPIFRVADLIIPLICQIGPKTSANSGCSCSVREKRCISGRNLASGIVGIRS